MNCLVLFLVCVKFYLRWESIAAFAVAKEEVDLTKNHYQKEMETLAVDMKSLRADISSSFFEFSVVEIQEDVKSIIKAHRIEIASLTQKVEDLESLLADSTTKVSTLQVVLQNAQEVLQMLVGKGECVGLANSWEAANIASANKEVAIMYDTFSALSVIVTNLKV